MCTQPNYPLSPVHKSLTRTMKPNICNSPQQHASISERSLGGRKELKPLIRVDLIRQSDLSRQVRLGLSNSRHFLPMFNEACDIFVSFVHIIWIADPLKPTSFFNCFLVNSCWLHSEKSPSRSPGLGAHSTFSFNFCGTPPCKWGMHNVYVCMYILCICICICICMYACMYVCMYSVHWKIAISWKPKTSFLCGHLVREILHLQHLGNHAATTAVQPAYLC